MELIHQNLFGYIFFIRYRLAISEVSQAVVLGLSARGLQKNGSLCLF